MCIYDSPPVRRPQRIPADAPPRGLERIGDVLARVWPRIEARLRRWEAAPRPWLRHRRPPYLPTSSSGDHGEAAGGPERPSEADPRRESNGSHNGRPTPDLSALEPSK